MFCQAVILRVFKDKSGISILSKSMSYTPVHPDIAQAFKEGNAVGPEATSPLYFGENYKRHPWNCALLTVWGFIDSVKQNLADEAIDIDPPTPVITTMFHDCIHQSQMSWKKQAPRVDDSGERMETVEQAQQRARDQETRTQLCGRSNARKREVRICML